MADWMFDGTGITGWVFDGHLPPNSPEAAPAGCKFDAYPGRGNSWNNTPGLTLVSGTVMMTGIWLPGSQAGNNVTVTSLKVMTGATAGGTMTHWWFVLCDTVGQVRAVTADQTTAAIAANTLIPLPTTATFTVPYTGWYYLGVLVTATTMPTVQSIVNNAAIQSLPTILAGTSSAGQTTPPALLASLAVPTAGVNNFYGAVG